MTLEAASVNQKVRERFGAAGLKLVTESLWAVDCQTCGATLRGEAPTLAVDEMGGFVVANLHHRKCRPSEWNDSGGVVMSSDAHLSYTCLSFVLPLQDGERPDNRPVLLVNPGLEIIMASRDPLGRWSVEMEAFFTDAGLRSTAAGPSVLLDRPVAGATAHTSNNSVTVQLQTPPYPAYSASTNAQMRTAIQKHNGLLLIATHSVNPGEQIHGQQLLQSVLAGDRSVGGWVQLAP